MRPRQYRYFMGDFETTVYEGQKDTEVWASAVVELFSEDVKIHHSIDDTFTYLKSLNCNVVIYYHNLKFDGSFWLSYLLQEKGFMQAYNVSRETNGVVTQCEWLPEKQMPNKSFKYSISDRGQWYTITIKIGKNVIEIRDSLKLLPFSVKRIGESFGTKRHKLDMEYEGYRFAGCVITEEEQEYIKNDVLVVNEALEIMKQQGHDKLTIGSCCLDEFKKIIGKEDYELFFPDLSQFEIDRSLYQADNADEYIRKAYRGGWCYVVKGKEHKVYKNGITADVNSLYPSVMHSESVNHYPVGKPCFWKGNYIPDDAIGEERYYYIRVKTKFRIKSDKLPFIQIKNTFTYKGTECLETSDFYDSENDCYYEKLEMPDGTFKDSSVILTLSVTDYKLIKAHYDLFDFEILDGCWFFTEIGIFDDYINKYKQIKMTSKGAVKELAKLFLNNLYGKLASSTESSFKVAYIKPDGSIGFNAITEHNKKAGHIASGAAITSYARYFTITAAQLNYYGVDKPGFIYADTDSNHFDLEVEQIKGMKFDNNDFCCWKLESFWDEAIFTRQKTYIEHVTHENRKPVEPYYNIKCAGMPQKCKDLFTASMQGFDQTEMTDTEKKKLSDAELQFVSIKRTLTDFDRGLTIPGKLMPKRIPGGILLKETTYKMR